MTNQLMGIVNEYRSKGTAITDREAKEMCNFCYRKMKAAKIQNQEEYLPVLFEEELRNYLFRFTLNSITMLMIGEEVS